MERRLGDQTVISHDAERRAERAELALLEAEDQLHRLDQSLNQRDNDNQQLIAHHKQVSNFENFKWPYPCNASSDPLLCSVLGWGFGGRRIARRYFRLRRIKICV